MITTNLQFFIQTIINNQLKFFSQSEVYVALFLERVKRVAIWVPQGSTLVITEVVKFQKWNE